VKSLPFKVSDRTVRSVLSKNGYKSRIQVKKPFISPQNVKNRLDWARKHKDWTVEQWKKVLWSDESPFVLKFAQRERVWRQSGERYLKECTKGTVKHDKKVNVWGCFASNGVGALYRVNGILKKEQMRQILMRQMIPSVKTLFPDNNFLFQQDNDPKHTSKVVQTYLKNKGVQLLDWPAQSPDLNPIENLWSILDKRLKDRVCSNESELFEILERGWKELDINLLTNLVASMPRRCQAVLESKGFATKY
jgi:transposase